MAKHLAKTFKPLFDRVLVERAQAVTKSAGGILLPNAPKTNEGVVIAVGNGIRNNTGDFLPLNINVGDKVLLPEYGGVKLSFEDKEATLYRYFAAPPKSSISPTCS